MINAALDLPVHNENGGGEQDRTDAPINQSVGFVPIGVEISQPTKVISVTTIIPSQNLR